MRVFITLDLKKLLKPILLVAGCFIMLWASTSILKSTSTMIQKDKEYVILAYNDIGMHCIQSDYSSFMILPPANTVHVQVFEKGIEAAKLINSGIIVEYKANNNTTSTDKVNFWEYAKSYGFNLKQNEGITGNYLSGTCKLSKDKKYYEAEFIPITPYNDGSKIINPYQTMTITVKDAATKNIIAVEDAVVVPVSNEMLCSNCHGKTNTDANILKAHDKDQGTKLYEDSINGAPHSCNECHADNALNAEGKVGVPSLSLSMHDFHASKMTLSSLENTCYNCHPGVETKCNRGVMAANGLTCSSSKCHGDMEKVANSQKQGRQAWLNEPDCGDCHGEKYASNTNQLYRNSYLLNGPEAMNGNITCETCHNSPHAEWPSTLELDNKIPIQIYGEPDFIRKCSACHEPKGEIKIHGYKGVD